MRAFGVLIGAGLLAACSAEFDRDAAEKGEPAGLVAIEADRASGNVELALPGARLALDVPRSAFGPENIQIEGLPLPPGAKVENFRVNALEVGANNRAMVRLDFTAPLSAAAARQWFLREADGGRSLRAQGAELVGATREGNPFRVTLAPAGEAASRGTILIQG